MKKRVLKNNSLKITINNKIRSQKWQVETHCNVSLQSSPPLEEGTERWLESSQQIKISNVFIHAGTGL